MMDDAVPPLGAPGDLAPVSGPRDTRPRGRRPAGEDTRGTIVSAALAEFGSKGYDGTTMRGVARAAGVDARLVHHYFEGKEELFVAAVGFPARPAELLAPVLAGPRDRIGEGLVLAVLSVWEAPAGRERIVAILSGALTSEAAARMLREFVARELVSRLAAAIGAGGLDRAELRVTLAASHLVGLALGRVVLRIEPLPGIDIATLARIVGPVLQRYLTDPDLPG